MYVRWYPLSNPSCSWERPRSRRTCCSTGPKAFSLFLPVAGPLGRCISSSIVVLARSDALNHEARLEHERMRDHRIVLGVGVLLDVEILLNRSVGVRKQCPLGSD